MPESLRVGNIARNRKMRRLVLRKDAQNCTPVAVHHRDLFTLAVLERVLRVSVEHAERERVGVEQEQIFFGHIPNVEKGDAKIC